MAYPVNVCFNANDGSHSFKYQCVNDASQFQFIRYNGTGCVSVTETNQMLGCFNNDNYYYHNEVLTVFFCVCVCVCCLFFGLVLFHSPILKQNKYKKNKQKQMLLQCVYQKMLQCPYDPTKSCKYVYTDESILENDIYAPDVCYSSKNGNGFMSQKYVCMQNGTVEHHVCAYIFFFCVFCVSFFIFSMCVVFAFFFQSPSE